MPDLTGKILANIQAQLAELQPGKVIAELAAIRSQMDQFASEMGTYRKDMTAFRAEMNTRFDGVDGQLCELSNRIQLLPKPPRRRRRS